MKRIAVFSLYRDQFLFHAADKLMAKPYPLAGKLNRNKNTLELGDTVYQYFYDPVYLKGMKIDGYEVWGQEPKNLCELVEEAKIRMVYP